MASKVEHFKKSEMTQAQIVDYVNDMNNEDHVQSCTYMESHDKQYWVVTTVYKLAG